MKTYKKILLTLCVSFAIAPVLALAHPGGTASDGKHYCRTNCSSWGVPYGVRHGHGSSGTTRSSIPTTYNTPTYTPTTYSVTPTYKTNIDCGSYQYAYAGSCYSLPNNAKKSGTSGFNCNYGYESNGYGLSKSCRLIPDNGHYIGNILYCDYGYYKIGSSCFEKRETFSTAYTTNGLVSSTQTSAPTYKHYYQYDDDDKEIEKRRVSSKCFEEDTKSADKPYFRKDKKCYYCDAGYITNKDKTGCMSMASVCTDSHGSGSTVIGDGECGCKTGYSLENNKCVVSSTTSTANTEEEYSDVEALCSLAKSLGVNTPEFRDLCNY